MKNISKDIRNEDAQAQGLLVSILAFAILFVIACSTNPATGDSQFTAFMSPQQEAKVGASEHQNIIKQYGLYKDPNLQSYINQVGARLAKGTERSDVKYKFFIIDSPIVNAFALPGGYVYLSRGLLALANNEAELAAVTGHEIGHITGRHSAERYSTSVVTSLGANLIALAVDSTGVSQALGLGSNLFLSSYSRGQENQADTLGIRYLSRGGYDPRGMSWFLSALQRDSAFQSKINGGKSAGVNYFSTHPATSDRVAKTVAEAKQYPQGKGTINRDGYLKAISGLTYGDSADQGFARGNSFYHPGLGFTFSAPKGFKLVNQPTQVIATSKQTSAVVVFDMAGGETKDPYTYLTQVWVKGKEGVSKAEKITVNGLPAATASFSGTINKKPMTIRLVSIAWNGKIVRFQIGVPQNAPAALVEDLKRTSYSFRNMTGTEKKKFKPHRIRLLTARSGETVASMAKRQTVSENSQDYFMLLNGLKSGESLKAGQQYKIISN